MLAWSWVARVLELPEHPEPATLEAAKALVAAQRRVLARRYHPDVGGDLARMQQINRVADFVERAEHFGRRQPAAPKGARPTVRWAVRWGWGDTGNSTTGGSYWSTTSQ